MMHGGGGRAYSAHTPSWCHAARPPCCLAPAAQRRRPHHVITVPLSAVVVEVEGSARDWVVAVANLHGQVGVREGGVGEGSGEMGEAQGEGCASHGGRHAGW